MQTVSIKSIAANAAYVEVPDQGAVYDMLWSRGLGPKWA